MKEKNLTIGELAKLVNITARTLRYYDNIGLLTPSDYKEGGHRLYSLDDYKRLQQIQSLKFLGFSLKSIEDLLTETYTPQKNLDEAIDFKTRELLAQKEEIERTINQLEHMKMIIANKEHINLSLFCFVLYAMIWEETNLDTYSDIKEALYNITDSERLELDKVYFELYTKLKMLVAQGKKPNSSEAQILIEDIVKNVEKTVSFQTKHTTTVSKENVYNPFTNEEISFLEKAKHYYLQNKGYK
ncbi:MerR family transcriptional regulator [Priestia endophytica]